MCVKTEEGAGDASEISWDVLCRNFLGCVSWLGMCCVEYEKRKTSLDDGGGEEKRERENEVSRKYLI